MIFMICVWERAWIVYVHGFSFLYFLSHERELSFSVKPTKFTIWHESPVSEAWIHMIRKDIVQNGPSFFFTAKTWKKKENERGFFIISGSHGRKLDRW